MSIFVKTSGINGSTKVKLDTRTKRLSITETDDTRVGDLGLDESRRIQLELGTNFKSDSLGTLGVPRGLTRGLEVTVDTVVVRGSIVAQVVGSMNSNTIFSSGITDSSVVTTDLIHFFFRLDHPFFFLYIKTALFYLAIQNVVGNFGTNKETLLTENGVNTDVGLIQKMISYLHLG